ncbi:histidine phosphatase family protein [Vibrio intestinalis]|uniref:histidine phosphatase family protein n=1 Tax=Vibrio intestinalis TaxID=2933291 RepID=UPI0021A8C3A6
MKTVNIYLLRHGKTQAEPGLCGSSDVLVSEQHQNEIAKAIIEKALDIQHIITSPLRRCSDLADKLQQHSSAKLQQNKQLQEMHFGDFDGIPFEQLKAHWPLLEQFWQQPAKVTLPNAEPLADFYLRVSQAWHKLVEEAEQDTLVVCHGGTVRMILADILALDWQNPTLYSRLQINHHSLTHIKITKAEQNYIQVCAIGTPLSFE